MKKKCILILFILNLSFLTANPFTGKKTSPTPVYQGQPSENILKGQRVLNQKLGDYINDWKESKNFNVLVSILGIAFLYGLVHAAGPGHRKTIIFSFYLAKESNRFEPLFTGLALAGTHGGAAIVLMLIFKGLSGAVLSRSNDAMIYMEGISFLILIALSIYGIIDAVKDIKTKKDTNHKKLKLGAILLSGIYPCPAAMLVLVLAVSLNILPLGIFAVTAMSFGMSLPIIASGYLAWAGRTSLFYKLKNKEKLVASIGSVLQIGAYVFLLYISVKTALPFILSLFRILK
ncbi:MULTISPECIES: hypothetical protein [unclassified Treponema]|uniref:HoxN/HupN/NixA family nickel/cobalt transporter n=1 Tax=unclassified Treponema TaxID=2638727 RepID=UPI0020A3A7F5|nr:MULTISPECIES: hypothetical protein [unclassified Treponema]UTC66901.1 hypothetical protein E4O06_13295 [Treponema sp. OMZ 789]UTC69630.1 hypothetical protein E4O01_13435 [Treponema sp. OMZ 790]UTC72344.1 hypothetical protein E4O02_13525 [Treponema sp. OMZ 791]